MFTGYIMEYEHAKQQYTLLYNDQKVETGSSSRWDLHNIVDDWIDTSWRGPRDKSVVEDKIERYIISYEEEEE